MEHRTAATSIKGCAYCKHPLSMHVRRGCIAFDDTTEARCACPTEVAVARRPIRPESVAAA